MEEVGESALRNREFRNNFSRESLIKSLVDQRVPAPILLDVGAHKGESVRFLRRLIPSAQIHSFEPSTSSFAELRTLADNTTHCHNVALSDVDGTVEFFANTISHTNSMFRVNENSRDSLYFEQQRRTGAPTPQGAFNVSTQVRSVRLSTFCREHALNHIHLLKIDVQGAESKVLTGAAEALLFTDCIILEIMFFDYYEHQGSFSEIEAVIRPFGFRLFSISDISYNPMNGRTDWVEAIYRRAP